MLKLEQLIEEQLYKDWDLDYLSQIDDSIDYCAN